MLLRQRIASVARYEQERYAFARQDIGDRKGGIPSERHVEDRKVHVQLSASAIPACSARSHPHDVAICVEQHVFQHHRNEGLVFHDQHAAFVIQYDCPGWCHTIREIATAKQYSDMVPLKAYERRGTDKVPPAPGAASPSAWPKRAGAAARGVQRPAEYELFKNRQRYRCCDAEAVLGRAASDLGIEPRSAEHEALAAQLLLMFDIVKEEERLAIMIRRAGVQNLRHPDPESRH